MKLTFLQPAPFPLLRRMTSIPNLDQFRSTRIKKPTPTARQSPQSRQSSSKPEKAVETPQDAQKRDWSRNLTTEKPLQLIFIGHNPSDKSWDLCAPYAHVTNRFWPLLKETDLVPPHLCMPSAHAELPRATGIGFVDLFVTGGSDASLVRPDATRVDDWRAAFLNRVVDGTAGKPPVVLACLSKIVAKKLLKGWNGDFGSAGHGRDWQLAGLEESEVWVLPSTSGRAGMTWEKRLAPFRQLADRLAEEGKWKEEMLTTPSDPNQP